MQVADIHTSAYNVGGWLLAIAGVRPMFTNIPDIVGSGVGSWIGTSYGDRVVKLGLVMPREVSLGETDPWASEIVAARAIEFGLLDFDGTVVELFKDYEPDATTDTLGQRLSPLDDPAPDPFVGLDGELITVRGRHVGLEAIGPNGERRHYWIAPDDVPPGLDHFRAVGWPPVHVTDTPVDWAGREWALYRIVQDPDTGTWPNWGDQYAGKSQWAVGKLVDRGRWQSSSEGRLLRFAARGPSAWLERTANVSRPTRWYRPTSTVQLTGDRTKVAVWIEPLIQPEVGDGISLTFTLYDCQTLASGNTLAGLTTREEIWAKIDDIVQTVVDGTDHGSVLAATNAQWVGPAPSDGVWNNGIGARAQRAVRIGPDGSTAAIKCEQDPDRAGFRVRIALDVSIVEQAGWRWDSVEVSTAAEFGGTCLVGGPLWGEPEGAQVMPPQHVVLSFSTRNEYEDQPQSDWDNNGSWRDYQAPFASGVVALQPQGSTELRLKIGEALCEGQHGQPWTKGATLDGQPVDESGYWVFRGPRLTTAELARGETKPTEFYAVAACEWVTVSDRDAIAVDTDAFARIRILRFLEPRTFGLPFDKLQGEPWVAEVGALECAPIGVIGGVVQGGPDWRHRTIPRTLLSSGTSEWSDAGATVTVTPGANQPPDLPAAKKWQGDIEVADLGLGIAPAHVDWQSWERCAAALPGGPNAAINRITYALFGTEKISTILREAMGGAGWAWSFKRRGATLAFGCWDPLRQLTPQDIEVTLRRDDIVEYEVEPEQQWRGVIDLRDGGPYDTFEYETDRNPIDGRTYAYALKHDSQDSGQRYRSRRIPWPVKDGGLHDPGPWIGRPEQALYDWTGQARTRFAAGFGPRYARQTRIYSATYNGRFATQLGLGTIVRVIDPTAESRDGTRGVNHMGRVIEVSIITSGKGNTAVRVRIELQPRPADEVKVWSPLAVAGCNSWNAGTNTMTVRPDFAGVGNGHSDVIGFTKPAWATGGDGALRVRIFQSTNGRTWPSKYEATADVIAADPNTHTLELSVVSGRIFRDMFKWIVMDKYDQQTAGWALQIYAPITEPNGKYDGTNGTRLK